MIPEKIFIFGNNMRELKIFIAEAEKNGYVKSGDVIINDGIYCQQMVLKVLIH